MDDFGEQNRIITIFNWRKQKMKKKIGLMLVFCFALGGLTVVANAWQMGFEGEPGLFGADWASGPFATSVVRLNASGSLLIGTDEDVGNSNTNPPAENDGWAVYSFSAPAGDYKILFRYSKEDSNSFWLRIVDDTGGPVTFAPMNDPTPQTDGWFSTNSMRGTNFQLEWDEAHNDNAHDDLDRDPVIFTLAGGDYQIQITRREDGVYLDGLVITDDMAIDEDDMPDYIPIVGRTENPSPADGATTIALAGTVLMWDAQVPTMHPAPLPTQYNVYFGDSQEVADPNRGDTFLIGSVAAGGIFEAELDTLLGADLAQATTYYWRVDAYAGSDANTAVGSTWSFDTIIMGPVITTQPASQTIGLDCTTSLSVEAISGELGNGGDLTYQWFKEGVEIPGETGATLLNVGEADAVYHVEITNDWDTAVSQGVEIEFGELGGGPLSFSEGLLGYWPLDVDGSDASGNGHHLTIRGDPEFINGAMYCDGNGDDVADNATKGSWLEGHAAITMMAWVKSDVIGTDRGFIIAENPHGSDHFGIRYDLDGGGGDLNVLKMAVYVSNDSDQQLETSRNQQTTEWQHVVMVWEANEQLKCYLDGQLDVPTENEGGRNETTKLHASEANFIIGRGGKDESANEGWLGFIDEVAIWSRALSQEEIQAVMEGGASWKVSDPTYDPPETQDGWINPEVALTVGWTKGDQGPCDATYRILFGTDPNTLLMEDLGTTELTSFVIPAEKMDFDSTYYWVVVVERQSDSEIGDIWSFLTIKRIPVVLTNPVAYTRVEAGETVTLMTEVSSLKDVPLTTCAWFKEGEALPVFEEVNPAWTSETDDSYIYECTLTLDSMDVAKEGRYYCQLTNSATAGIDPIETTRSLVLLGRLMLHYTLDSIAGGIVADSSDSNIDGTLVSTVEGGPAIHGGVEPGIIDNAIRLLGREDPNSAYIETGVTPADFGVDGDKPRTISAWVKVRLMTNGGIWDMGNYSNGMNCSLRTRIGRADDWRVQHWGGADINFSYELTFNSWVNFVYTYDGSRVKVYANGAKVVDSGRSLDTGNDVTVRVGSWQSNIFDGLIDDFRLYNYVLSGQEIGQLYVDVVGGTACSEIPLYDWNENCTVGVEDFAKFAEYWMNNSIVTP